MSAAGAAAAVSPADGAAVANVADGAAVANVAVENFLYSDADSLTGVVEVLDEPADWVEAVVAILDGVAIELAGAT